MTREELLDSIRELRRENYSYQFIGDALGVSINTVKSICRRYGYEAVGSFKTKEEKSNAQLCRYCHKPLQGGKGGQTFCSETCRNKWWQERRKIIRKPAGLISPSE